ncbi:hypothetical protein AVEN_98061-1 [Araneus ventricosus]|uniref:Uncharacterized protein n=1 Tax=Araneus ventricosus TaxID=182803 RepID=A0A4Y2U8J2_ARAVE|nr:hypothetical protein AVEN_98061-1 [Araneus ventricosus]
MDRSNECIGSLSPVLSKLSHDDPTKWFKTPHRTACHQQPTSRSTKYTPFELDDRTDRAHLDDGKSYSNARSETLSWRGSDDTKHKKDRTRIREENMFIILCTAKN